MDRVSLWIDGELSAEEATRVETHVMTCAACRDARADHAAIRAALRGYQPAVDQLTERRALHAVLAARGAPVWRRRVSVPVPALAAIAALVIALVAIAFESRPEEPSLPRPAVSTRPGPLPDLSRFDGGHRMAIQVVEQNPGAMR